MTTLSELFQVGYTSYKNLMNSSLSSRKFEGLETSPYRNTPITKPVTYSNFERAIDINHSRIHGFGRGWGQATPDTQYKVMELILEHSKNKSAEDQAILLSIARLESGFNPDAAALTTSASGVFQIIKQTASYFGLSQDEVFDAKKNIIAGIELFDSNLKILNNRFPDLTGNERALKIYALHHDGPSLNSGGENIARKNLLPFIDDFRAITYQSAFNEAY